ncbi:alpha/beta fold hydrolase [Nocardia sp. NPDC050175]|uniref:alpha/beta hydrolase family protein n=1 Tax=Nocardia sp. NPDC050175 TaxID=3364317 RepID=UPI0037A57288
MNEGGLLIPAAEMTTQIVRAEDGATIEVRIYRQAADPTAPVLVCMPAMGTRGATYVPFAEALARAGFQVVVGELRGQGTSSVRVGRGTCYGYHEIVTRDYPALFHAVEANFPSAPRYLFGHSLGGQLGALYLGQQPTVAAGAILVGAPSCHYRSWPFPRNLGILGGAHLALGIGRLVGYFPGRRIGVLGDDSTQLMRDFATQVRTGSYRVPSSALDLESGLAKVRMPVLAVAVEGDSMATARGVQTLGGKLANASVTHWNLLLDTTNRNPHYDWIRDNAVLIERIRAFVDTNS